MNVTTYERGIEKGIEKGRREERLDTIRDLLQIKFESAGLQFFGEIPGDCSSDLLAQLRTALLAGASLDELRTILK